MIGISWHKKLNPVKWQTSTITVLRSGVFICQSTVNWINNVYNFLNMTSRNEKRASLSWVQEGNSKQFFQEEYYRDPTRQIAG